MIRKILLWLHRWLGLLTGVVVVIVSLTGCINVFADELKECFYHDRFFTEKQTEGQRLGLSVLRANAQRALGPKYKISRCEIYPANNRNWIFRAAKTDAKAFGHWDYYQYYYRVYVDPHNGTVKFVEDTKNEFFQLVMSIHLNLLLGEHIGGMITGISVATFFVILLSGFVIWWPKRLTIKGFRAKMTVKRGAGPKRLNYDLHNALGFYVLIPAIIISMTGLVFAFKWADASVQFFANGAQNVSKRNIPKSTSNDDYNWIAIDHVVERVLTRHQNADMMSIRFRPKSIDPFDMQVRLESKRTHHFEWYYFDRNTGSELLKYGSRDVGGGEKLKSMNYDLHTGAYAGLPTKVLAFLVSLFCASLPITGFMIWYNKPKVKRKT